MCRRNDRTARAASWPLTSPGAEPQIGRMADRYQGTRLDIDKALPPTAPDAAKPLERRWGIVGFGPGVELESDFQRTIKERAEAR
jgi:hypothetical protein